MAKKFSELRASITPAARARSDAKAQLMLAEIPPVIHEDTSVEHLEPDQKFRWYTLFHIHKQG
jgi:hypothetical protein